MKKDGVSIEVAEGLEEQNQEPTNMDKSLQKHQKK